MVVVDVGRRRRVVIGESNSGEIARESESESASSKRVCDCVRGSEREKKQGGKKERSGVVNTGGGQCDIIAYSHGREYTKRATRSMGARPHDKIPFPTGVWLGAGGAGVRD